MTSDDNNVEIKSVEHALQLTRELTTKLAEVTTKEDLEQAVREAVSGARSIIGLMRDGLAFNLREVESTDCQCPNCEYVTEGIKKAMVAVEDLAASCPSGHCHPAAIIYALGVCANMLVQIPILIVTMGDMVQRTHAMVLATVEGKIVAMTDDDQEEPEDNDEKPN